MGEIPKVFCLRCATMREVVDWRDDDDGDGVIIEVEPCGHVILRTAYLEWVMERSAALTSLSAR